MAVDVSGIMQAVVALPVMVVAGYVARKVWDRVQPKLVARATRVAEREVREGPINWTKWWAVTALEDAALVALPVLGFLLVKGVL